MCHGDCSLPQVLASIWVLTGVDWLEKTEVAWDTGCLKGLSAFCSACTPQIWLAKLQMGGCDSVGCLQISGLKNMHVLCQCFGIKCVDCVHRQCFSHQGCGSPSRHQAVVVSLLLPLTGWTGCLYISLGWIQVTGPVFRHLVCQFWPLKQIGTNDPHSGVALGGLSTWKVSLVRNVQN